MVPLVLAGCGGPLSTLAPAGPAAREIAWLWWAMLGGSAFLTALVLVLLGIAFLPRRPAVRGDVWTLGLGVGLSILVLGSVLTAGFVVGERIFPRGEAVLNARATARQWSWDFTQPGPDGAAITTTDTLYIPAGQPVDVTIVAEDVIHSFWVPQLGGKMDAVPGRINTLRIEADTPGTHDGLCAEFCGLGHTDMRFRVVVYAPGAWPEALLGHGGEVAP